MKNRAIRSKLKSRSGGVLAGAASTVLLSSFSMLMLVSALLGIPGAFTGEQASSSAATGVASTATLVSATTKDASSESSKGTSPTSDDATSSSEGAEASATAGIPSQDASSEAAQTSDDQPTEAPMVAQKDATQPTTLEKKLKSVDGHTYTVRVSYGLEANVPEGTELQVVELNQIPADWDDEQKQENEYKERPYATEALLSADDMAKNMEELSRALEIGEDSRILWNKTFDVSLVVDGQAVTPNAEVQVEVETDSVPVAESDALEAALLKGDGSRRLQVTNATGTKEGEADKPADGLASRVALSTAELGRIGLAEVAQRKFGWVMHGDEVSVYGARAVKTDPYEVPLDLEYVDGLRLIEVFEVEADPTHPFGTTLWVESKSAQDAQPSFDGVLGYRLVDGRAERVFGLEGTNGLAPFSAASLMALVWDSGMRHTVLDAGDVTVAGEMPVGTTADAADVTQDFPASEVAAEGTGPGRVDTVAARSLSFSVGDLSWRPDAENPVRVVVADEGIDAGDPSKEYEVVHVADDGTRERVTSKAEDGSIAFDGADDGTYVVVRHTVESYYRDAEGNTWKVTAEFGPEAGLPADVELKVRELAEDEAEGYRERSAEAVGEDPESIEVERAFDITFQKDGVEYHDLSDDVRVTIQLLGQQLSEGTQVVHMGDAPEAMRTTVDGDSLSFDSDSFSVYVVVKHEGEGADAHVPVTTPQIQFHFISPDAELVSGSNTAYNLDAYSFINKNSEMQTSQILTNGESLELVTNPPNRVGTDPDTGEQIETAYFYGWYVVSKTADAETFTWPALPDKISFQKPISVTWTGQAVTNDTDVTWTLDGVTRTGKMDANGIVHVYLAPIYENFYFVNFRSGSWTLGDSSALTKSLQAKKLIVFGGGDEASVRIGNVSVPSPDPAHQVFVGLQEYGKGAGDYYATVNEDGREVDETGALGQYYITINKADVVSNGGVYDLYPVFAEARWLYFNSGKSGSGAQYVEATYRLTNDQGAGNYLPQSWFNAQDRCPGRSGYDFGGWYANAYMDDNSQIMNIDLGDGGFITVPVEGNDGTINHTYYSAVRITDGNGNFDDAVKGKVFYTKADEEAAKIHRLYFGDSVPDGGTKLFEIKEEDGEYRMYFYTGLDSLTLSARWDQIRDTEYRVVIWKQKVTDHVTAPDSEKTYDFETVYTSEAVSSRTSVDPENFRDSNGSDINLTNLSIEGFHYNSSNSDMSGKPASDGTTVYNIYYDRNVHTLHFQVNSGSTYTWMETTDNNGNQYGLVNGGYTPLTRTGDGYSYTNGPAYKVTSKDDGAAPVYGYKKDTGYFGPLTRADVNENVFKYHPYEETASDSGTQYALVDGEYVQLSYGVVGSNTTYTYRDTYTEDNGTNGDHYGVYNGGFVRVYYNNGTWYRTKVIRNYSNPYTGKRYRKSTSSSNQSYTGTVYVLSGTTFTETNVTTGNNLYGMDASGTTIYKLTPQTTNTYGWVLNGVEYLGTRYVRSETEEEYTRARFIRSGNAIPYTYTPTSAEENGLYGIDSNGGRVPLSMENVRTGYAYSYNNAAYTGTLYTQEATAVYTGTRYMDNACTIPTSADGDGQYGKDANGVAYPLTRQQAYKWTYIDPKTNEDVIYTGTRYVKTQGDDSSSWHDIYTITALYQQDISSNFPITASKAWDGADYSTSRWDPQSHWGQVMVYVDVMPDADVTFHRNATSNTTKHIYYYVEALPGEAGTRTYNGKAFVQHSFVDANYNFFTEDEDYVDIIGFSKSSEYPPQGYNRNGSSVSSVWKNSSAIYVYCYYLRDEEKLTFNANYPTGADVTYDGKTIAEGATVSPQLREETVYYEAPLEGYGKPDGVNWYYGTGDSAVNKLIAPDHYTFEGWYEDSTCTKEFDFNSTMPAANKIIYAKWSPERFRIIVDPNGGEIDHLDHVTYPSLPPEGHTTYRTDQATYYKNDYHQTIGEYEVPRNYVPMGETAAAEYIASGKTVYYYLNTQCIEAYDLPGDLRNALYLTEDELQVYFEHYKQLMQAQYDKETASGKDLGDVQDYYIHDYSTWKVTYVEPFFEVKKTQYRPIDIDAGEVYVFLGWFEVKDGQMEPMPYVFSTPVEADTTLRARWRLDGGYSIAYHPDYTMDTNEIVTGELDIDEWLDPSTGNKYADGAETNIAKQPTGIQVTGGNNPEDYQFVGWRLVSVTEDSSGRNIYHPLSEEIFFEGDLYYIDANYADLQNVIHMQAVYEKKNSDTAIRKPEVTSLTLDANTNGSVVGTPTWDGLGDFSYNATQIVFEDFQSSDGVHLSDYAVDKLSDDTTDDTYGNFTHANRYFLLGFDDDQGRSDYIATYPADGIIANTRTTPGTVYAVWEPMVYINFVNTASDKVELAIHATDPASGALEIVNAKKGLYDRELVDDPEHIEVPAGETISLAIPNGAQKSITVSGTNNLGVGKKLIWDSKVTHGGTTYDTEPSQASVTYNYTDDVSYTLPHGEKFNLKDFEFDETLIVNREGVTVTFSEKEVSYAMVLNDNFSSVGVSGGSYQEYDYTQAEIETDYSVNPPVPKTQELTEPSTLIGYEFLGWANEPNGNVVYAPDGQVENLQEFFADTTYTSTLNEGQTTVRYLYAVWKANTEASKVYVYKEVPEPGIQTKPFSFTVNMKAKYKRSSSASEQPLSGTGTFTLMHGEYAVLESSNSLEEGRISTKLTIYNADRTVKTPTTMLYSEQASNHANGGSFTSLEIRVTETAADQYDTSVTRISRNTEHGAIYLADSNDETSLNTEVAGNYAYWKDTFAGGTIKFINTRQTKDVYVKKTLVNNTGVDGSFNFSAAYTLTEDVDGTSVTTTKDFGSFTVSSTSTEGHRLQAIPTGAVLTITESGVDDYNVTMESENGAEDTDTSDGAQFSFIVGQDDVVTFTNTLKSYPVIFKKVDQNGASLGNAAFSLYSTNNNTVSESFRMAAAATGIFYTSGKFYVGTYDLKEIITPEGYNGLTGTATLTVTGTAPYISCSDQNVTVTPSDPNDPSAGFIVAVKNQQVVDITVQKVLEDPLMASANFAFALHYVFDDGDDTTDNNHTETFSLASGGSGKTFKVPMGATNLTVEEILNTVGHNSYATTVKLGDTDKSLTETEVTEGETVTGWKQTYVHGDVNQAETITFTNKRKTAVVSVVKDVTGTPVDEERTFNFTADLKYGTANVKYGDFINEGDYAQQSFDLKKGNPGKTFTVPVGAALVVAEDTTAEVGTMTVGTVYDTSSAVTNGNASFTANSGSSFTLTVPGEDCEVTVTNARKYADVTINKTMVDPLLSSETFAFAGELTEVDGTNITSSVTDLGSFTIGASEEVDGQANTYTGSRTFSLPVGAELSVTEETTQKIGGSDTATVGDVYTTTSEHNANVVISATSNEPVTFTNTRKTQTVTVSKKLVDVLKSGSTVDFGFTATLYNVDGSTPVNSYNFVSGTPSISTGSNGEATFTLSPIAALTEADANAVTQDLTVPYGAKLVVAETPVTETVGDADVEVYDTSITADGSNSDGTLNNITEQKTVSFVNTRKTANVTIVKDLVDPFRSTTEKSFDFGAVLKYNGAGVANFTDGGFTSGIHSGFTIQASDSADGTYTLTDLPVGATLEITETVDNNYTTKVGDTETNIASVSVGTGTNTATFTNTRKTAQVTVNKQLIDAFLKDDVTFAFSASMVDNDNTPLGFLADEVSQSKIPSSFTFTASNANEMQTTVFTAPVGATLTVAETSNDRYNTTVDEDAAISKVLTVPSEEPQTISFVNERITQTVTVKKELVDFYDNEHQPTFSFEASAQNSTLDEGDQSFTLDGNTYASGHAITVPVGETLTITETEVDTDKYAVTAAGVEDGTQSDQSYSFVVPNAAQTVTFTNIRKTNNLTIRKTVKGNDTSGQFSITAVLTEGDLPVSNYAVGSDKENSTLTTDSDGAVTFPLGDNDSQVIKVPVGVNVTVREDLTGKATFEPFMVIPESSQNLVSRGSTTYRFDNLTGDTMLRIINVPRICKVTNDTGNMLLYRLEDNGTEDTSDDVYIPAVYGMIKDAVADANDKKLYTSERTQYTLPALQVQMLCDYTISSSDVVNVNSGSTLTFTTASPSASDGYSFRGVNGATRATLTRDTYNPAAFVSVNGTAGATTTFTMKDLVVDGNKVELASGVSGGVLKAANSDVTIDNCEISNSKADNGGAVYVSGGSLSVTNSSAIKSCEATNGGGIYVESGTLDVSNSTVESCKAITSGGGLFVGSSVKATIQSGTITKNEAQNGGGIFVDGSSTLGEDDRGALTISDGTITENTASSSGSAVYLNDYASASITGGSITANVVNDAVGAVGIAGENARINFSGAPIVYDNTHGDGLQNNVVLSVARDQVINVTGQLADGAKIGVNATDDTNGRHLAGADFASYNDGVTGDFSAFINDRDTALYGMANPDDAGKVCWCYGAVTVYKEWKLLNGYATPPSTVTAEVKRITDLSTVETVATITLNGTESVKLKLLPGYIYVIEEIKVGDTALTSSVYSATYSSNSVYVEPGENTNYVITNTNTLVPVQLQKEWDSSVPSDVMAKISEIAFSVTGTSGGGSSPVDCFTGNWPESPKITKLAKASDWQELVYVPKYDASGKPFTSYTIHEETIGEGGTGAWSCSSVYTPKVVSKENWKEDKDPENYQEMYLQFRAQNTEMVADRYKNIHKMDFYFRDAKDGKLYYSSTDFGSNSYNLNRGSLVEEWDNDYFYVRVLVPRNFSPEKAELLASADRSGIQLHQDTTCNYAYGILTYNVQGNKDKPTGAPDFKMRGEGSSRKFDWIAFVDVDSVPEGSLKIDDATRTLMVYVPATLTLTNKFDPIARVSNDGGTSWAYFGALTDMTVTDANGFQKSLDGAFNYANGLTGEVNIELLKESDERYAMTGGFSFNNEAITELTLSTTQNNSWNPLSGEEGHQTRFTSTISRGFTGEDSLISSSVASLTLDKIMLDGGSEESTPFNCTGNGGLIKVTAGTVNVGSDATLQNSSAANGGAIYLGGGTLNMAGAIDACQANALNEGSGGGIYVNAGATLSMTGGTITDCSATGLGGAVFIKGTMNMTGGTITGNSSTRGGAVNFYGPALNDGVINVSGSPIIVDNPSSDASQQKNIDIAVMEDATANAETVLNKIMVNGTLERTADIGVYAPTGNDQESQFFGKYSTDKQENFYCFRNDKYNYLYGKAGVEGKLQWQKIICKIVDSDNVEHVFATLQAAVDHSREAANAKDYVDGACTIQMLIEEYPLPGEIALNNTKPDIIVLTTAKKSTEDHPDWEKFFYQGNGTKSTIKRGSVKTSMFTVRSGASFTTQKIILDGGATLNIPDASVSDWATATWISANNSLNIDGGIIYTSGTLNVEIDSVLQNSAIQKNGGAIYVASGGALSFKGEVTRCHTTGGHGAGIYIASAIDLSGASDTERASVSWCKAAKGTSGSNGSQGGGIWMGNGTEATVQYINFSRCVVYGGGLHDGGAGLYGTPTKMTIQNCKFSDSQSVWKNAAGVFHYKEGSGSYTIIKDCEFENCWAKNSGGATETDSLKVEISGCTLTNCSSDSNGGGINVYTTDNASDVTVENCTFTNCKSNNNGGGLRNNGKNTTVNNCTFANCSAKNGGGVANDTDGTLNVSGGSFTNCIAEQGGGIYQSKGTLNLKEAVAISQCKASTSGGGVYMGGGSGFNLIDATIDQCVATKGGGVYVNAAMTISKAGDAITNCDAKTVTISNGTATVAVDFEDKNQGGGIYQNSGTITVNNSMATIDSCNAYYGGGVYLNSGTLYLGENRTTNGGHIDGCMAKQNGGGAYLNNGTLYINGGMISGPTGTDGEGNTGLTVAAKNGGGAYLNKGKLYIKSGGINNCKASQDGGGAYLGGNDGVLELDGTGGAISGCEAAQDGGGVFQNKGNLTIKTGTSVKWNKATRNGGGIYLGGGTFILDNGTVGGDKATEGNTAANGAGIYQGGGELTMNGGQIIGNAATANGGGVYLGGGHFTLAKQTNPDKEGVIGVKATAETGEATYEQADKGGNSAVNGGGLYVGNGVRVEILGGKITGNTVTGLGGGIATGGDKARLYFAGCIQVFDNFLPQKEIEDSATHEMKMVDVRCDVCLAYDTNAIINTTSPGLDARSHIGVYVTDELFDKHGKGGMKFGTFRQDGKDYDSNLNRFINNRSGDRYESYEYYYGVRKPADVDPEYIYWAEYICKITDNSGNLLFTNRRATAPALYQYLGRDGAFAALGSVPQFYNKNGGEATPAFVKMLVKEYSLNWDSSVTWDEDGVDTVTLTIADITDDDYIGDPAEWDGECVIKRGKCTGPMFVIDNSTTSFTLKDVILDGEGYDESTNAYIDDKAVHVDGGLINACGTLTLDGATLKNSNNKVANKSGGNGGAIAFSGAGSLVMKNDTIPAGDYTVRGTTYHVNEMTRVATIEHCKADNGGVIYVNAGSETVNLNSALNANSDTTDTTRNVIGCESPNGGMAYVNGGALNLNAEVSHFTNTAAGNGGAIYLNSGTVNLKSTIDHCTTTKNGGGVYVAGGTFNMDTVDSKITNCESIGEGDFGGGAIFANGANAVVNISAGEISGNSAKGQIGGAIRLLSGAKGTISGTAETTKITGNELHGNLNTHQRYGGAIALHNASLTIEGGSISNNTVKNYYDNDKTVHGNKICYGGAIHVNGSSSLEIKGGTFSNNKVDATKVNANGGVISATKSLAKVTISGGTFENNTAETDDGNSFGGVISLLEGAELTLSGGTFNGNTAITGASTRKNDGAAIYVDADSKVKLSGEPVFGNTDTTVNTVTPKEDLSAKTNGGSSVYTGNKARQDIFIAENNGETPQSIVITGDLVKRNGEYIGDESIWVWAENSAHCEQLMPFAKLNTGVEFVEVEAGETVPETKYDAAHLKAFRNARDDDKTDNGTDTWLYGTIEDDQDPSYVYWAGVGGYRKVILRKVASATYESLSGAKFDMYKGNSSTVYKLKDKTAGTETTMDNTLLESQSNGVFWVGTLPYGTYYFNETTGPTSPTGYSENADKWFYFILDGDYKIMSEGYADRTTATAGAKTDNDAIKVAKQIMSTKKTYTEATETLTDAQKTKVNEMLTLAGKGNLIPTS